MNARTPAESLLQIDLDDKYLQRSGQIFMSGTQALVRLPMDQQRRDESHGVRTAGFISGYRGSPLGRYDQELWSQAKLLKEHHIHFQPGVNEDLAATAVWGSQYVGSVPGARYDGVFGIWYGKGPGVDRSGDAFKHANSAGTSRFGGVLAIAGDDHAAKSSTTAHQSDYALLASGIPVLYPSNVQDILDFGLHGIAMSRHSGCWVAMKVVTDVVESSGSVQVGEESPRIEMPPSSPLPDGVNIRGNDISPQAQEQRLYEHKLYAAQAYARANGIDRIVADHPSARVGIISAGKAFADVRQALRSLGLPTDEEAGAAGLRVLKVGLVWPLDPQVVERLAEGLETLIVVEEKRPLLEHQVKSILYDAPLASKPRIVGKFDGSSEWSPDRGDAVFSSVGELAPPLIAERIARVLGLSYQAPANPESTRLPSVVRAATFCSGCPHNTSTQLPEGSRAFAGIGCHGMVLLTGRDPYGTVGQMGAEGAMWVGQAPFTDEKHIFANMGDGTYFHSGFLAIRQAVSAHVPITYKLLVNGYVSMTGGQPIDGELSTVQMVNELVAEGVKRIVVVADDPSRYDAPSMQLPAGVPVRHRRDLDAVQRELREYPDVSVLLYDQVCATERRRLRKRGRHADPDTRTFINAAVCEGCGDCSEKSGCLSVEPLETEFGRKRRINQSTCNKDYSCVEGFCPSFVTVRGGSLRKRAAPKGGDGSFGSLPEPTLPAIDDGYAILITGIGGTGVITLGAIVAMAAHIDGHAASALDMTGLAQKYGAVMSHVRIAPDATRIKTARLASGEADLVVGCDLIVSASPDAVTKMVPGRTRVAVNTEVSPTSAFARNPDWKVVPEELVERIAHATGSQTDGLPATRLATALMGDAIAANMILLGYAWQRGWLPVSLDALERAIVLNGVSVESSQKSFLWGRRAAVDLPAVESQARPSSVVNFVPSRTRKTPELIAHREGELVKYQNRAYAARYRALVDRVAQAGQPLEGSERLTRAVARYYYKLLAYKDEFEVARLYASPEFRESLDAAFEGDFRLHFNIGAWPFATRDPNTGLPRKRELGPWALTAMGWLARLRGLRNTPFDPFRRNDERRYALRDIASYEADIERLLQGLDAGRLETAVAIAELPEHIRGYGHVRERHADAAQQRKEALWQQWQAQRLPKVA
ncbi:indolepyruvate ferredoxin oxidoreductase [Variovorax sp. PBL-H6]|uniref:indolepyruvate ferredoxin oxidoreductase family protein n=1 Tax=Variovorax sp. PBL-H6 TaxID=434009 RepID=UPI0013194F00|nr:indolepyruvate ferredoxin oxidoreductase family protein [Variovorax sp. PBL-H6]VTU37995.1 indolepyruvate ferredoxin oxidoreductase [Variovorax sp. PBL-H6]